MSSSEHFAYWPNLWSVCIQAYRIHYVCFDRYNTSHFSSSWVIFICQMHSHRLLQSLWYYQPFNTVSKTATINYIPSNILLWIINFLSGRTQAVFVWANLWLVARFSKHRTRIRYQPLYPHLVYASDLRTLSPHNVIIKYADDTIYIIHYWLVNTAQWIDIIREYDNICAWSLFILFFWDSRTGQTGWWIFIETS